MKQTNKALLTFGQQRLWFLHLLEPTSYAYNILIAYTIEGDLDLKILEESISRLVKRHDAFRAYFKEENREVFQFISPKVKTNFYFQSDGRTTIKQAFEIIKKNAQIPFNLNKNPLWRIGIIKLENSQHLFWLAIHHIIFDGWSLNIFINEIKLIYESILSERKFNLPRLKIKYIDYSEWERKNYNLPIMKSQLDYWLSKFSGEIPVLELPTDNNRPIVQTSNGKRYNFIFCKEFTNKIKELSQKEGVTLYVTLLAAFKVLLYKYTKQNDIIIGAPFANRKDYTQNLIGFFTNTLAFRTQFNIDIKFRELLNLVRKTVVSIYTKHDIPFETIVNELKPERELSRSPIFQVMCILQNTVNEVTELNIGNCKWELVDIDIEAAKTDLVLELKEISTGISGWFEYNTDLFNELSIARLYNHFYTLLNSVINHPDQIISNITIIDEEEKNNILYKWNDTSFKFNSNFLICILIDNVFNISHCHSNILFKYEILTCQQYNKKIDQLALFLRSKGVEQNSIIAVMLDRSPEMIIAIFAILKAGGAYLPIDPKYPQERISFILKDSNFKLLITNKIIDQSYPCKIINITDQSIYSDFSLNKSTIRINDNDLAYVIYTSGSTGVPKGVMIEHKALANRIQWMQRKYPIGKDDVILQKTPFTFDVSVWELFWWVTVGASLCILEPDGEKDPAIITEAIEKNQITIVHFVPSMLTIFLEYIKSTNSIKRLKSLKRVFASGEELTLKQVRSFNELLFKTNGTHLTNLYGPTEATIDVSYFDCTPANNLEKIPIGKPIDNIKLFIVDDHLNLQPIGIPGELCISGIGLARGYLNRQDLTEEKFISNPFIEGDRLYKTGDLAKWLPDGNIEYQGRIDNQVKIRGNRIELGEIQAKLNTHESIKVSVVTAKSDNNHNKYLVAYYVSINGKEIEDNELSDFLRSSLPEYMIPSYYMWLDKIPLSTNGKLDTKSLPLPETKIKMDRIILPRTSYEMKISEIWKDVLTLNEVSVNSNFFRLGGHSLTGVQVITRINNEYNTQIRLSELFKTPTIEGLAKIVELFEQKIETNEFEYGRI